MHKINPSREPNNQPLNLAGCASDNVPHTGIRLLHLSAENANKFSALLDIPKRLKLLRRPALREEGSAEVFAQDCQFAGTDEHGDFVFIVLSRIFTRSSDPDKGGWFLVVCRADEEQRLRQYLAVSQIQVFANLQQERCDPHYIWTRKGPEYRASTDLVQSALTAFLVRAYRRIWNQHTIAATDWHRARESGLRAWAQYEAAKRFGRLIKRETNLQEFETVVVGEQLEGFEKSQPPDLEQLQTVLQWKLRNPEITNKHFKEFLSRQGYSVYVPRRVLCIYYDRHVYPFEFWTSEAIASYMPLIMTALRMPVPAAPNAVLVRQWLHKVNLKLAQPPVVRGFDPKTGGMRINVDAERLHGLPTLS